MQFKFMRESYKQKQQNHQSMNCIVVQWSLFRNKCYLNYRFCTESILLMRIVRIEVAGWAYLSVCHRRGWGTWWSWGDLATRAPSPQASPATDPDLQRARTHAGENKRINGGRIKKRVYGKSIKLKRVKHRAKRLVVEGWKGRNKTTESWEGLNCGEDAGGMSRCVRLTRHLLSEQGEEVSEVEVVWTLSHHRLQLLHVGFSTCTTTQQLRETKVNISKFYRTEKNYASCPGHDIKNLIYKFHTQ